MLLCVFSAATACLAQETNSPAPEFEAPGALFTLFRLLGALVLVIALFLGGVWLFRNWQRMVVHKGRAPRLNVHEARSLGHRHTLYVIGYDQQRLLIAASPGGVTMLAQLPPEQASETGVAPAPGATFSDALARVIAPKP